MEVIRHIDCAILFGHRDEATQNQAVADGKSQLIWPHGKHNQLPSLAIDAAPWYDDEPHVRWYDTKMFYYFAGIVLGIASQLGIDIRWGGDWDSDQDFNDQNFNDLVHFELKE